MVDSRTNTYDFHNLDVQNGEVLHAVLSMHPTVSRGSGDGVVGLEVNLMKIRLVEKGRYIFVPGGTETKVPFGRVPFNL